MPCSLSLTRLLALSAAALFLTANAAQASSHREAPLITEDPTADSTDLYAFVSPDKPTHVTILANYIPFEEPSGPPNYYSLSPSAVYDINIDNTGDAVEDLVYRFQFQTVTRSGDTFLYNTSLIDALDDLDQNVRQTYTMTRIVKVNGIETARSTPVPSVASPIAGVAAPRIGPRSNGDTAAYEAYAELFETNFGLNNDRHTFVGPRDEGFYVDVNAIFDLLNVSRAAGLGTGIGRDYTAGFNVHTIALQAEIAALTNGSVTPVLGADLGGPNAVLGIWTSCSRPKHRVLRSGANPNNTGPLVQVSRLGLPLINEVVVPVKFKDQFNRSHPKDDLANIAGFVTNPELSILLNAVHGVKVPPAGRPDMVDLISFLPTLLTSRTDLQPADLLRLNVAIPPTAWPAGTGTGNRLGVIAGDNAGFPNGRRPADDVVDIEEQVVGGGILSSVVCPDCVDSAGAATTSYGLSFPGNALNDGVTANDVAYLDEFPYLGTPHDGFEHSHE
jgi:hypothetical protein